MHTAARASRAPSVAARRRGGQAVEVPTCRFDRSHFKQYGDFALIFETVYYVLAADYKLYMDIQQAINLELYEQFEREGIEFAYPMQTVFVPGLEQTPEPAP